MHLYILHAPEHMNAHAAPPAKVSILVEQTDDSNEALVQ